MEELRMGTGKIGKIVRLDSGSTQLINVELK